MQRNSAEGQAGLSRLLTSGAMRLARQVRLSKGQAAVLAVCLLGAVTLGVLLQPRGSDVAKPDVAKPDIARPDAAQSAAAPDPSGAAEEGRGIERVDLAGPARVDPPQPAAPAVPPDSQRRPSSGVDAATTAALDRLASEIVKINRRLDEVVSSEKETRDRVAALGASAPGQPAMRQAVSRDAAARQVATRDAAGPPQPAAPAAIDHRRITMTARRAPVPAAVFRRIAQQQEARERIERRIRFERRARFSRRRGFAGLRSVFGVPIRF